MFSPTPTLAATWRCATGSLSAIALACAANAAHAITTYDALLNPAFYDAPAGWQQQPHGKSLRFEPVSTAEATRITNSLTATGGLVGSVQIWRLIYTTTGPDPQYRPTVAGAPLLATGIVIVPTSPTWTAQTANPSTRPVVLFAPKTQGLGSQCAPSKALELGKEEASEVKRMAAVLNQGYALAVTDYDGYINGSAAHHYLLSHTLGHAVLDLGLAMKEVAPSITQYGSGLGVTANSPMVIWGYSEGGTAAAWAGQLLRSYAPTLEASIKGVATGGLVADMKLSAKTLDSNTASALMLAAVWGYHVGYPKPQSQGGLYFEMNDTFKQDLLGSFYSYKYQLNPPSTDSKNAILHPEECVDQLVLDHPFKTIRLRNTRGYTITQIMNTPSLGWGDALLANTAGNMRIPVPTYLYFGTVATSLDSLGKIKEGDFILPAENFNGVAERMCANGTALRKTVVLSKSYLGISHQNASDKAFDAVTTWIGNQFAGQPTPIEPVAERDNHTLVTTACN